MKMRISRKVRRMDSVPPPPMNSSTTEAITMKASNTFIESAAYREGPMPKVFSTAYHRQHSATPA